MRAAHRRRLPDSAFAYPRRRTFPIDTIARARNALARAAQSHTHGTYQHVARAVRRKWGDRIPTVGPTYGTVHSPGKRGTRPAHWRNRGPQTPHGRARRAGRSRVVARARRRQIPRRRR